LCLIGAIELAAFLVVGSALGYMIWLILSLAI
jgi:hypothetical protein